MKKVRCMEISRIKKHITNVDTSFLSGGYDFPFSFHNAPRTSVFTYDVTSLLWAARIDGGIQKTNTEHLVMTILILSQKDFIYRKKIW